ncbi:MAG: DUF2520 domain-containing protein [Prevotellaceae bacterium]|jgi:predicted short-subunit dehydrogenase-like oxidoreductase (DUF2520 family)|nr:DUF2520 domain-containing protein [Prevotellaceae bacterium]
MNKVVIIGSGNVARSLAHALPYCGCAVEQIFSRNLLSAESLALEIGSDFTDDFEKISTDADFYIYAVSDDALRVVAEQVKAKSGIHLHTSGSVEMNVFEGKKENFGVLYPFQTFSKQKLADFKNIPIFIEANSQKNLDIIFDFAKNISNNVLKINSLQRKEIHLAGVFACNFSNFFYSIADDILRKNGLPFEIILPLIEESVQKLHFISPKEAQTGPAVRGDKKIIGEHLKMLADNKDLCEIYRLISGYICQKQLVKS